MSEETQERAGLPTTGGATHGTRSTEGPLLGDPSSHFCTVSEIIEFLDENLETRFHFIKEVIL